MTLATLRDISGWSTLVRVHIPFNRPALVGRELEYIQDAVASGQISCSGKYSQRVRELLGRELGCHDMLLTTSCTDALEMTALLLDLGPGDTVIVPSFAFVSTALAYARTGAKVIFADINPHTLGLDPDHVESLIDKRTRAVVAIHYAGIPCAPTGFADLCAHHDIVFIEDAAHALFATEEGQSLGTFGRFGALSFHETKNFVCGEGGALLLNDEDDVDRAHILLDKGTDRRRFQLGLVDKYTWRDTGSSFGLSDLLAAYLLGQIEQRSTVLGKRGAANRHYRDRLADPVERFGVEFVSRRSPGVDAFHMFAVLLPSAAVRDGVLNALRDDGIMATFHYVPLHSSEAGMRFNGGPTDCPVTDDVSHRLLRLPFYTDIAEADIDHICTRFVDELEQASIAAITG